MVPHIALGQYGFLVDYNDGELLKIELDNPTNEIAIGTSMQQMQNLAQTMCYTPFPYRALSFIKLTQPMQPLFR